MEVLVGTKNEYKAGKMEYFLKDIPIIQNMDFGHTAPQICMPSRSWVRICGEEKRIAWVF